MKLLEFEDRVAILEKECAQDPSAYRFRTAAFAIAGYLYPICIVSFLILFGVACLARLNALTLKLGAIVLYFSWVVLRALWIKVPPPEGRTITAADAPALFEEIEAMRQRVQGPPIHEVKLTSDMNAMIAQRPRLGFLGWQKNYLLLGLDYLCSVSPEHFRATLAHEMGHLSGSHGVMGAWIYRNRSTWEHLGIQFSPENLAESGWLIKILAKPFSWFYGWYGPRIAARSFVLIRQQEYEADEVATNAVSAAANCEDLGFLHAKGAYVQTFVDSLWSKAAADAQPPADAYTRQLAALRGPLPQEQTEQALRHMFNAETDSSDTHPCVRERWLAARVPVPQTDADFAALAAKVSVRLSETAADRFLPPGLSPLVAEEDRAFVERASGAWTAHGESLRKEKQIFAELSAKATTDLDVDQTLELARLYLHQDRQQEARQLLEQATLRFADSATLRFLLGRILLAEDDATGESELQTAARLDTEFEPATNRELLAYYRRTAQLHKRRQLLEQIEA